MPGEAYGDEGPLRGDENSWRAKETISPLNGSPFSEKTCSSFQSEDLFFVLGIR